MRPARLQDTGVKHLNPRQGITTARPPPDDAGRAHAGVKHLNPRQGITTQLAPALRPTPAIRRGVKHLNPRQGITTQLIHVHSLTLSVHSVKHLNPRQGITTPQSSHLSSGRTTV